MPRRFQEHHLRQVADLAGVWDFSFLGDVSSDTIDLPAVTFADRMAVPACFDATPAYAGQRGLAAYRTRVALAEDRPYRLVFDGVHHWCRIVLNGQVLGEHAGGFTRFAVDIPPHPLGEGELVVLVDNRFDALRSPLHRDYFDWYHFGGLTRGVELHRLGAVWLDALRVVTEDWQARRLVVAVDYQAPQVPQEAEFALHIDGQLVHESRVRLLTHGGTLTQTVTLPGAALWSPADPQLHRIEARLGADDLCDRFGVRQVTVQEQQILLNGQALRLLGINRHESHPQFGHALPEALILSDVQLLRDLGCNFVRGSHYPQDQRFLDLCDEFGICVSSEALGWEPAAAHLTDAPFVAATIRDVDEMVAAAFNHPSIILWGALNEGESANPACRPAYEAILGRFRTLDASRPVTYASLRYFDDCCGDLADVISLNVYPGWYTGELATIPEQLDKIINHLDAAGQQHKPIIISEIGAAALYGCRDAHAARWTEQYQATLLDRVLRYLFLERDRCCGVAIWQFCDIRTTEAIPMILGRARGFNNKGILDEYRRPKLAYDTVKRWFHELPPGPQAADTARSSP